MTKIPSYVNEIFKQSYGNTNQLDNMMRGNTVESYGKGKNAIINTSQSLKFRIITGIATMSITFFKKILNFVVDWSFKECNDCFIREENIRFLHNNQKGD